MPVPAAKRSKRSPYLLAVKRLSPEQAQRMTGAIAASFKRGCVHRNCGYCAEFSAIAVEGIAPDWRHGKPKAA